MRHRASAWVSAVMEAVGQNHEEGGDSRNRLVTPEYFRQRTSRVPTGCALLVGKEVGHGMLLLSAARTSATQLQLCTADVSELPEVCGTLRVREEVRSASPDETAPGHPKPGAWERALAGAREW